MTGRGEIHFLVPVYGNGLRVTAQRVMMADGAEGLHSFRVESDQFIAGGLHEACLLADALLTAGMTWTDLATFRNSNGIMAALIEAGHNRLVEVQWAERGDGHAA